ncbi:hypothetical protein HK096_003936 [Nowakowskiella sp. JEL0078]|nr:hypothetical protein HK096_003936 [Nowakowskiella sp. JEL0078]
MSKIDVLIVGAGPVGLFTAVELTRRLHSVRIIDRLAHPSSQSRAFIVHCRTLELLALAGLDKEFMAEGVVRPDLKMMTALNNGEIRNFATLNLDNDSDGSEYEFALLLPQNKIEAILTRRLESMGVFVERGMEFRDVKIDFTRDDSIVASSIVSANTHSVQKAEVIRSKYLIGSDGVHSSVRKSQVDWTYEGVQLEGAFGLADGILETTLDSRNFGIIFHQYT